MQSSSEPVVVRGGKRRRGRGSTLVAVLLLAWLLGRGLGWFGSSASPSSNGEQAVVPDRRTPAAATSPTSAQSSQSEQSAADPTAMKAELAAAASAADQPVGQPADRSATRSQAPTAGQAATAAPSGESVSPPPAVPPVAKPALADQTPPTPALDADRFASGLSLVQARTADGRLGSAFAALQHLRSLSLDAEQTAALADPAQQLEQALAAAGARLLHCLQQGDVLPVRADLDRLLTDGTAPAPLWCDQLRQAGLDGNLRRPLVAAEQPAPIPRPLARNREVRVSWRDELHAARIVDSRSDQVTVRIQTVAGQAFPTLAVLACEPVAPSPDEAIEMGLAALQAKDALAARLWLAVARLRSDGALPVRGEQLSERVK